MQNLKTRPSTLLAILYSVALLPLCLAAKTTNDASAICAAFSPTVMELDTLPTTTETALQITTTGYPFPPIPPCLEIFDSQEACRATYNTCMNIFRDCLSCLEPKENLPCEAWRDGTCERLIREGCDKLPATHTYKATATTTSTVYEAVWTSTFISTERGQIIPTRATWTTTSTWGGGCLAIDDVTGTQTVIMTVTANVSPVPGTGAGTLTGTPQGLRLTIYDQPLQFAAMETAPGDTSYVTATVTTTVGRDFVPPGQTAPAKKNAGSGVKPGVLTGLGVALGAAGLAML